MEWSGREIAGDVSSRVREVCVGGGERVSWPLLKVEGRTSSFKNLEEGIIMV